MSIPLNLRPWRRGQNIATYRGVAWHKDEWFGSVGFWTSLPFLQFIVALSPIHTLQCLLTRFVVTLYELVFLPTSRLPWSMPEVSASANICSVSAVSLALSLSLSLSLQLPALVLMQLRLYREGNTCFWLSWFYSVMAGNILVSKEVRAYYGRHMLQQAGYQRSSVLVAAKTLPQAHALRNTSHYCSEASRTPIVLHAVTTLKTSHFIIICVNVKMKTSYMRINNQAQIHEDEWKSGCISPPILKLALHEDGHL
jgi:hypothetical protein